LTPRDNFNSFPRNNWLNSVKIDTMATDAWCGRVVHS